MIDEAYVSAALHDLADDDTVAEPPTQHLRQRTRRRRRVRAGATVSAATVVAAVAVTAVAAMPGGGGDGLAAAQQSQPVSYRFTLTIASHATPSDQPGTVMISNGAYDPVHRRGFMNSDDDNTREVAVGDVCYTRDRYRSRWDRTAEPCRWADGPDRLPAWISTTASPCRSRSRPTSSTWRPRRGDAAVIPRSTESDVGLDMSSNAPVERVGPLRR